MSLEMKSIKAAIQEMRNKSPKRNFEQSVELIINLSGVDVKKPEERIQETVELPRPIGKKVKVAVIASGDMALRARKAGADLVLEGSDLEGLATDKKKQRKIANEVDAFIASAPLMPLVGRTLGAILGPRNKMPTPVPPTANIEEEIERHRRIVQIRARGQPVLQCRIGTESMADDDLAENIQAVINKLRGRLKRGLSDIGGVFIKTTMGPPVEIRI
ncbi:MAG: 50S ribosomal protein L1 [Nitrososphaerota archaeon]|nr:50S ribosomal protein L1 [Candidatus Bathyarchaeota archaeon]MDW8048770.1 50S ribosomal protein L1 [Nitrososphaerota archaeon]